MLTRTHTLCAAVALSWFAGCAASTGDDAGPATLTLALTDAPSDDLTSFCVDIDSIRLIRPGGATVGVLPDPIRVDLVTLTDVSQILNVAQVPAGTYVRAEITFDFTNAEAWLVGENTAAGLFEGDGVTMLTGNLTLPITVVGAFSAIASRNRVLELDFDLDHSVRVDTGANAVFVEPAIVLRVDRSDPKEMVVVGDMTGVNLSNSVIEVEMQTLSGQRITDISVGTSGTTVYQINGVASTGSTGLTALDALGAGTWVQLYGTVNPVAARVEAAYIEAGTGTYNGGSDIVQGHVVQRLGGAGANATLTVLGHSNNAAHTAFQFNTLFTVNTEFAGTAVTYRGTDMALDTDAVNIGQQVRVFGNLTGTTLAADAAANGVLRMQPTRVLGFANTTPAGGTFDVDVSRIDLRDQADFTWTDGGPTPPDPDAMNITSGSLTDGLGITGGAPGTAVEVRGYFPSIGDAGDDFIALSVTNRSDAPSMLLLADRAAGMTVTPTITTDLSLALAGAAGADEVAVVDQGFVGSTTIPTSPALTLQTGGPIGIYILTFRSTHQATLHLTYTAYLDALNAAIGQGSDIYNIAALGMYSGVGTNTLTTNLMVVVLD